MHFMQGRNKFMHFMEKRRFGIGNTDSIITLSFGQVHVKHKRPQVLSLDSLVKIGMIQQT